MAIIKAKFIDPDSVIDVEMPEPFDCIMSLRPLKPALHKKWAQKAGYVVTGTKGRGDEVQNLINVSPDKILEANKWLARQLIVGWQGLQVIGADGELESFEYTEKAREMIAEDDELLGVVMEEAGKLAGQQLKEEEKN